MSDTSIEWTDKTWNPTNGCEVISPGCANCYAMRFAGRFAKPGERYHGLVQIAKNKRAIWTGVGRFEPSMLALPMTWRTPKRVFVNSMSDLFHDAFTNEQIAAVFGVMAACPQHVFQCLTKRPARMREWFAVPGVVDRVEMFRQIARAGRIKEYFAPERTVDIAEWPGYAVTSKGRVVSNRRGTDRELRTQHSEQGHGRVQLYHSDGRDERVLVHRLVLSAFDRMPNDGEQGCHITGDAANNALWNLRWGSQSDNWDDRKLHGNRRSYSKLTDEQVSAIRGLGSDGISGAEIGRRFDISDTQARNIIAGRQWAPEHKLEWPLRSVWLGVSVENQDAADERIPELLDTPAAVRFLSCEPLIGEVDLFAFLKGATRDVCLAKLGGSSRTPGVDWVIAGCESGPGARACDVAWLRSLRDQCAVAGTAFFLKQAVEDDSVNNDDGVLAVASGLGSTLKGRDLGAGRTVIKLPHLDGKQHKEFPDV